MRWLPWPLPALLSWAAAWAAFMLLRPFGDGLALLLATLAGAGLALLQAARWRRLIVALGFPVSVLTLSTAVPAWAWLLPLLLLLLLYPMRSWSDAPLFPTPRGALQDLPAIAPLLPGARILDAGCGLGHGLRELARVYPQAQLEGIEWSRLLAGLARAWLRASRVSARVIQGDLWEQDWTGFDMIYVFQRPESMPLVATKARLEMGDDSWLVSLDFEIRGEDATARLDLPGRHQLWVYKIGLALRNSDFAEIVPPQESTISLNPENGVRMPRN